MSTIDLIVQTIAAGAIAERDRNAPPSIGRAYLALLAHLQETYPNVDLDRITRQPDSPRGRDYLAEDLTTVAADKDATLLALMHALIDALAAHRAAAVETIGVDLEELTTESLRLRDIASSGTGIRARRLTVHGTTAIEGVRGGGTDNSQGAAVAIGESIFYGDVYIGADADKLRHIRALRESYLRRLVRQLDTLALGGVDPKAATQEQASGLRMSAVYTALWTQTTVHTVDRLPSDDRQALRDAVFMEREERRVSALEQLNRHDRLVLLGDPGSGKSTFVNFVALCMAGELLRDPILNLALLRQPLPPEKEPKLGADKKETEPQPQPWDHGPLLPVRVVLRDFAASGLLAPGQPAGAAQLWRFLNEELAKAGLGDYGEGLQQELRERGGLILLDGLDEVPEADARRTQLKAIIEDFAAGLGHCRILLTSRTYAYQQQAWQLPDFTAPQLAPFSDGQISHFVERWYVHRAAVLLQDAEVATGRAELLKHAIFSRTRLRDLVERPLLLTLTASLHAWRGGSLPERREELYADAVDLLLDTWEAQRLITDAAGNQVPQPSLAEYLQVGRERVLTLLQRLAYEAHARQPELVGTADLAEDELVLALLNLNERRDVQPWLLVDYLSQRAGLLIPRGVQVYTFPHRTFQEYLAACHLTGEGFPEQLSALACSDPNRWREALLLAAAKVARGTPFALWSLVDELCPHELTPPQPSPVWGGSDDLADETAVPPPHCTQRVPGLGGGEISTPPGNPLGASPTSGRELMDDAERGSRAEQAWGALLAGQAIDEVVRDPETGLPALTPRHRERVDRVRHSLLHVLTGDRLPAAERALAGRTLAHLGDPRPGVLTVAAMPFAYVPHGPFLRHPKEESTEAELPYGYWMARYPVTNAQFAEFVAVDGYRQEEYWQQAKDAGYWSPRGFKGRYDDESRTAPYVLPAPFGLANHPVVGVSWYEAVAFCRWLSAQLPPAQGEGEAWVVRLPTEAEWEKCAVGGLTIPVAPTFATVTQLTQPTAPMQPNPLPKRTYPWGDNADEERANCEESQIESSSAVGCFAAGASPYGVEELSGNVWEWSHDDHKWGKMWCGGYYRSDKSKVVVSSRSGRHPDLWYSFIGFRCVVVPISHAGPEF